MAPGSMSSLAVASTVSRSAIGSNALRFAANADVPPKEQATATKSAGIRVVMILLLDHADELTVADFWLWQNRTSAGRRLIYKGPAPGGRSGPASLHCLARALRHCGRRPPR